MDHRSARKKLSASGSPYFRNHRSARNKFECDWIAVLSVTVITDPNVMHVDFDVDLKKVAAGAVHASASVAALLLSGGEVLGRSSVCH